jgi:hypothetical protein
MTDAVPFWKRKRLEQMSRAEWESLCDGCGRCCLHKLRDEETEELAWTEVACRLLDTQSCRCADYANRRDRVPDCVKLTAKKVAAIDWLPPTCAYRLLTEGQDLPAWHPLVSGRPESVHEAGVSVRGKAVPEREAGPLTRHIVTWPGRIPRAARPTRPHGESRGAANGEGRGAAHGERKDTA